VAEPAAADPITPPPGQGTLRRLAWLHFWNDFTLDFVSPLLPTQIPLAALGAMEGAADAAGQGLRLVTGRASDRDGRRARWVRAGYGVNAVARPLLAVGMLLSWPWWIAACRITDRLGKGVRGPATDALVADWAEGTRRVAAYAAMRTADHLGATLGALAAAAVAWWDPGLLPWAVAALVLPMLVQFAILPGVRDAPRAPASAGGTPAVWWPKDARTRRAIILLGLSAVGARLSPLLVLVGVTRDWPLWQQCLGWAALGLAQTITAAVAGALGVRIGARATLVIGWIAGALLWSGLAIFGGGAAGAGLALGWAVLAGCTEGMEKAWLAELAPASERGAAFGAFAIATALGTVVGSAGIGWLLEPTRQGSLAFLIAAAVLALCVALMPVLGRARASTATA